MELFFTYIYENNIWGDNKIEEYNGSSGSGSSIEYNNDTYIPFLKKFIINNNIKTVIDLGCGDFLCGKLIYDDLDVLYTGYDTYKKIVDYNITHNLSTKYSFIHLDFCNNKEKIIDGDLFILKDVIQHWSCTSIYNFIDYLLEFKNFKYILICNDYKQLEDNVDTVDGGYRALNCNYFPLKKYNLTKIFEYNDQEIYILQKS
jgi:hypothetical protein